MSFRSISLPDKTPRDSEQLRKKIPLNVELTPFYFFGVFTLVVPFFPIIAMAVNGHIGNIGLFPLIFFFLSSEVIAFLLLNLANRNYLRRLKAFSNGSLIKGKVIEHGRNFVFWKSSRNYNIKVAFVYYGKNITHTVSSKKSDLHQFFPVGFEINGLYDRDSESICFPPELGLILELKETPNRTLKKTK